MKALKYIFAVVTWVVILWVLPLNNCLQAQNSVQEEQQSIYDRVWILKRLNNKKIVYKQGSHPVTLVITSGNEYASGSSGCNTYVSQVVIKRNHILFRSIGCTKMACPEDSEATERIYINNLNDVDSYKIIDEDLYFYKNERPVLVFGKE